ncbi:MAG: family transporter [Acidimicrobiales bacterium]|nr:family transporter [Acidimicrobiales bacterium]
MGPRDPAYHLSVLDQPQPVPVRTIAVTIGMVLATVLGIYLFLTLARIEALLVVAAFFAVVLTPAVDWIQDRLHLRRALSTLVVFLIGVGLLFGMLYLFIRPLVDQVQQFSDDFPTYVTDARAGRGTIGRLVKRYKLDTWVDRNKSKLQQGITRVGSGAVNVVRSVAVAVALLLTVMVLAFMMILYGPDMLSSAVGMLSPPNARRVRAVGADCAKAITGYVFGNLLISVIAGLVTFFGLLAFGVPFRGVLALWVGFADLIPLVGATLGAIPTIGIAFLHSVPAGIGMLAIYIVYQQVENHIIQPVVMARTVNLNQLFVLVSVLAGVELFGFIGALLAIPAAGVIQVIVRDVYNHRKGRLKDEPTIGTDEVPLSEVEPEAEPEPVPPGIG